MSLTARTWDRMYRGVPSWELRGADPILTAMLETDRIPVGRAIDLGCGTGDNAIDLARRGWDVVGIDISERALDTAREKAARTGVSVTFVSDDVTDLRSHGIFDLVVDRGLLMSLAGERARQRYVRSLETHRASDGRIYSAQWVVDHHRSSRLSGWLVSLARALVLTPDEMEKRFGGRFAIEILSSESRAVDDKWMRRLGLRYVREISYWLEPCVRTADERRPADSSPACGSDGTTG